MSYVFKRELRVLERQRRDEAMTGKENVEKTKLNIRVRQDEKMLKKKGMNRALK